MGELIPRTDERAVNGGEQMKLSERAQEVEAFTKLDHSLDLAWMDAMQARMLADDVVVPEGARTVGRLLSSIRELVRQKAREKGIEL